MVNGREKGEKKTVRNRVIHTNVARCIYYYNVKRLITLLL